MRDDAGGGGGVVVYCIVSPHKVCVTLGPGGASGGREEGIRPRTELNESDIIISLTSPD